MSSETLFNGQYYVGPEKYILRFWVSRLGSIELEGHPQGRLSIPLAQTSLELIGDPKITLQIAWSDETVRHALLCRESGLLSELLALNLPASLREKLLGMQQQQRRNQSREKNRVPYYLLMTAAFLLAAYIAVNRSAPVVADWMPYEWERKIGSYALEQYKLGKAVIADAEVNAAVNTIVQRIDQFDDADIPYQLTVIDAEMVNAFAFPGGFVVVTSGLLEQADGPEQVAAVLAHELTHVIERHGVRKLVRQAGLGVVLGIVFGDASALSHLLELSAQLNNLAFDRDQERQADEGAVKILRKAGISPSHLAAFFDRIKKTDKLSGDIPELFRTHPLTEERANRVASAEEPAEPFHFELDWPALQKRLK